MYQVLIGILSIPLQNLIEILSNSVVLTLHLANMCTPFGLLDQLSALMNLQFQTKNTH